MSTYAARVTTLNVTALAAFCFHPVLTMTNLPLAKRTKGKESRNKSNWQVRGMMRLGQLSQPGVYPLTLIVAPDGGRQLVVENGKIEDLGS